MSYQQDMGGSTPEALTLENIATVVGAYYTYDPERFFEPFSGRRDSSWSDARGALYTIGLDHTALPYAEIARRVHSDPPRIHRFVQKTRQRVREDSGFAAHVQDLTRGAYGEPLSTTLQTWVDLATQYFDVPIEEAASALQTDRALLTRQVLAHLLTKNTTLLPDAVAHRTGFRAKASVEAGIKSLENKRLRNSHLDEDIAQLESGELPPVLRRKEIFARICAYYDITPEELVGSARHRKYVYPRLIAQRLLVTEAYYSASEASYTLGKHPGNRPMTTSFEEQAALNPNLLRDAEIIKDPQLLGQGQPLRRLARKVCTLYGVDLASLQTERPTDKVARARSVTAYLAIESGIPEWQIRRDLNCDRKAITAMEVGVMLELAANRFLEAEVTYLATTDQVHSSLDRRISHLVAEAFDVSPDEISRPQTPAAAQAQDMALRLLAERRHTSLKDLRVTYRLGNYELVQAVRRSIRSRHPGRVRMIRKMLLTEQADISTMARAQAEEVELETTEPEAQAGSESIVNDDIASVQ